VTEAGEKVPRGERRNQRGGSGGISWLALFGSRTAKMPRCRRLKKG